MNQHSLPNTIDECPSHIVTNASIAFQRPWPLELTSQIPVRFSLGDSDKYLDDQFTFVPNNCDNTKGDELKIFGYPSRRPGPGRGQDGTIIPTIGSGLFEIHRLRPEFSHITMETGFSREENCPKEGWTTWSGPVKFHREQGTQKGDPESNLPAVEEAEDTASTDIPINPAV